jgi:predicted Ser/Thr protein kinase
MGGAGAPSGSSFVVDELLKQDDLGRIERGRLGERAAIRRVAAAGLLGPVARLLLGREARALEALAGLPGVAEHLGRPARGELLRGFVPGVPLHRAERLPEDFFALLEQLVGELHARGVAHNDLHKEPNVLVGLDGRPALVDFQLASLHRPGSRRLARRAAEDLRHVAKHAARYRDRDSGRRPGRAERGLVSRVWMATGKRLYNLVTRRLLQRPDAEGRRPRGGPWPEWGPPIGPP